MLMLLGFGTCLVLGTRKKHEDDKSTILFLKSSQSVGRDRCIITEQSGKCSDRSVTIEINDTC